MQEQTSKKLSPEEVQELRNLQDDILKLTAQLGQNQLERFSYEKALQDLDDDLLVMKHKFQDSKLKETKLQELLIKKYGTGSVDLESGVFISNSEK